MTSPFYRRLSVCMLAAGAFAQTPAESDAIRQLLWTLQQKAANSLTVLDAPTRPSNWQSIISADMDAASAAAAAVSKAAAACTTGRFVPVPAGTKLQFAVDAALPGDTLVLQAGATYTGPLYLPAKTGTDYVTITSSAVASLPRGRVTPASAIHMPKIASVAAGQAIITKPGAHHYRLVGLEITCGGDAYCNTLIQIGTGAEATDGALPYAFELDRLYVHGTSSGGGKRGIQVNGKSVTVRNSHVSGFFSTWQETQAVQGWNTPGPLTVDNNYLEASGMGFLMGGAEPAVAGVHPSDIEITRNHISRPLAWRGANYVVKNLLELKVGRRVKITGNVLENAWLSSQVGYAFNIKQGTENVKTPAITTDVLIADNVIRRATGAIGVSAGSSNVTFRNNLIEDVGPQWGAKVPLFAVYNAPNTVIENNTAGRDVLTLTYLGSDGVPSAGLVFRANIVPHGLYGAKGSSTGTGLGTLNAYFPGAVFSNNVIYGAVVNPASYPPGNYFPSTMAEVGFTDPAAGKYGLSALSPYKGKGVAGMDPGIGSGPLFQ